MKKARSPKQMALPERAGPGRLGVGRQGQWRCIWGSAIETRPIYRPLQERDMHMRLITKEISDRSLGHNCVRRPVGAQTLAAKTKHETTICFLSAVSARLIAEDFPDNPPQKKK